MDSPKPQSARAAVTEAAVRWVSPTIQRFSGLATSAGSKPSPRTQPLNWQKLAAFHSLVPKLR